MLHFRRKIQILNKKHAKKKEIHISFTPANIFLQRGDDANLNIFVICLHFIAFTHIQDRNIFNQFSYKNLKSNTD